ncbi:MAG: penicillin-binding transpeptidase domain-containing protein, partial [Flavobacteriaceae bacterium]|nr:penicillin-binding transpeptidase domain-containing protein [Flavobacteriaceae bacterium]
SVNTIAVKVLKAVRISPVIDLAHRMGINSDIPAVPSIALGTAELSLLELATAYTGYANRGVSPDPYFITKIEDSKGKVIYEYQPKRVRPAFSENTRQVMVEMMKSTVNEGTAVRMRSRYGLRNDIAGKTGTTQDNKDGWFVGIMPKLVVATWVGHDDHRIGFRNTRIGQGANSAMPAVALFLQKMNADKDYKNISWSKFPAPSEDVIAALDCEPEFRDSFFDRLFSSDENERDFGGKKSYREEIRERKAKYRKSKDDSDD